METLKVGVHRLPTAQAGLVRALVVLLSRGSPDFRWSFSQEAPYDALIVHSDAPDLGEAELQGMTRALSSLGRPGGTVPADLEVLEWPLRAERLESWLSRVQQKLSAPVTPHKAEEAAPMASYRLKRWPPEVLLHADASRIRLATLLSRRPLALADLSRVSGQSVERCQTFVQLLLGFGLLEASANPAPPRTQPPAARVAAPASPGLILSIRRRLGL